MLAKLASSSRDQSTLIVSLEKEAGLGLADYLTSLDSGSRALGEAAKGRQTMEGEQQVGALMHHRAYWCLGYIGDRMAQRSLTRGLIWVPLELAVIC